MSELAQYTADEQRAIREAYVVRAALEETVIFSSARVELTMAYVATPATVKTAPAIMTKSPRRGIAPALRWLPAMHL